MPTRRHKVPSGPFCLARNNLRCRPVVVRLVYLPEVAHSCFQLVAATSPPWAAAAACFLPKAVGRRLACPNNFLTAWGNRFLARAAGNPWSLLPRTPLKHLAETSTKVGRRVRTPEIVS